MNRSDAYWDKKMALARSLAAKAVLEKPIFSVGSADLYPQNMTVVLSEAVVAGCLRVTHWVAVRNEFLEDAGRERAAELVGFGDWLAGFLVEHGQLEGPAGRLPL